jgi:hypothetical protein
MIKDKYEETKGHAAIKDVNGEALLYQEEVEIDKKLFIWVPLQAV